MFKAIIGLALLLISASALRIEDLEHKKMVQEGHQIRTGHQRWTYNGGHQRVAGPGY